MSRAVLFDLDGTLIDSASCVASAFQHSFALHGLRVPEPSEVVALMGIPIERSFAMIDPRAADPGLRDRLIATYREQYRRLAPDCVRAFAGVQSLLHSLHKRGTPLAIVTSKKSGPARENCEQTDLWGFIRVLVGSDDVTNHKPHPEPALLAMSRLERTPPDAVVVGDATFDIEMARSAGIRAIGVSWGAHKAGDLKAAGADAVASTVDELSSMLLD